MHVVSDADVLIHLSKLEKLPLLQSLYKEVAIPDYVKSKILLKERIQWRVWSLILMFSKQRIPYPEARAKDDSFKINLSTLC